MPDATLSHFAWVGITFILLNNFKVCEMLDATPSHLEGVWDHFYLVY